MGTSAAAKRLTLAGCNAKTGRAEVLTIATITEVHGKRKSIRVTESAWEEITIRNTRDLD
jgi:hypothetical protein